MEFLQMRSRSSPIRSQSHWKEKMTKDSAPERAPTLRRRFQKPLLRKSPRKRPLLRHLVHQRRVRDVLQHKCKRHARRESRSDCPRRKRSSEEFSLDLFRII